MQIGLLKPHVNAGVACAPGAVLSLDTDLAQWLVDTGVARSLPAAAEPVSSQKSQSPTSEKLK